MDAGASALGLEGPLLGIRPWIPAGDRIEWSMRILITNDDGIRADGIQALVHVLCGDDPEYPRPFADEIMVVAPETVQSAASHGITFAEPLMVADYPSSSDRVSWVAVNGRPADCVKLALSALWPERFGEDSKPDLVLSGINAGANAGINVIYSGTVAAAIEAAFLGVPSLALSQFMGGTIPDWPRVARRVRRTLEKVLSEGLPRNHSCLSLNFPKLPVDDASGTDDTPKLLVAPMNTHGMRDRYERRESPYRQAYYWLVGGGLDFRATDAGTDVEALKAGHITLTPLRYDLSDHGDLEAWRRRLARGAEQAL